jgi:hypothetical protein
MQKDKNFPHSTQYGHGLVTRSANRPGGVDRGGTSEFEPNREVRKDSTGKEAWHACFELTF